METSDLELKITEQLARLTKQKDQLVAQLNAVIGAQQALTSLLQAEPKDKD